MNKQLIESHYDITVSGLTLLDSHFGTAIYLVGTPDRKYIAKELPHYFENVNEEGFITEFLFDHGLKVARLIRSKDGNYAVKMKDFQFTIQEYIEGETLAVNTAPKWFMEKSAEYLGKATFLLKDYGQLPMRFGKDFFSVETATKKKQLYENELMAAINAENHEVIPVWEEQIRHLNRIAAFGINTDKLTYANSHGDYHIGQAIVKDNDITVIDWTSACRFPICLDIITSYVFASPTCAEGAVDAEGLKKYIESYMKYFSITEYDIKAMPYVLYFWHCICNYRPDELSTIAQSYQPIAKLVYNMLNWLYDHVEELAEALIS